MAEISETEQQWRSTHAQVRKLFAELREDDSGNVAVPESVKTAMKNLGESEWNNDRRVYTFGTGETQQNILAARAGLVPWWPVFTGAVFFGALDDLRVIKAAADRYAAPDKRPGLNSALTWITFSNTLVGNVRNKIEPSVIRQLMEWGADPNHDGGNWFAKALRNLNADCIKPFLDHGGSYDTISAVLADGNNDVRKKVLPLVYGRSFMTKNGDDTLVQTQCISDFNGITLFRTIFNFRAQRVHEIYEAANTAPVMKSYDFDGYNTAMLGDAHTELKKRGGAAPDILRATGKPLAVPKGLKRAQAEGQKP
ncbi:MAG: hypothetical protein Q8K65_00620 [Alphaproteobacteria bacterium]|nr:hypothetical protein [Alphaproteobacteria bacterium]